MAQTTITTVEEVHNVILKTAADLANAEMLKMQSAEAQLQFFNQQHTFAVNGDVFRPDQSRSEKGGLCLSVDEMFTKGRRKEEIEFLHAVGKKAIHNALVKHGDLFAGVLLGEMKHGRNYFDRFKPNAQLRML